MKRTENHGGWVGLRWCVTLMALAVFALGSVSLARADDTGQGTSAARLSSVDGQVQIFQGNQVIADQALANTPLFEGMQVATAEDGRAEIQFEDGSVARISPNSVLLLTAIGGQGGAAGTEIALVGGLGYFELQNASVHVKFGDCEVTGSGFTVLRVDLDNPPGELAVFSGNARVERGNSLTLDLHGGESVALSGADASHYTLAESIEPNSWDAWNSDRDQALTSDAAAKTGAANSLVNEDNPAWNDLDANGTWYSVPSQGMIWSPYAASNGGWDPYGCGHWMWTPRFGYIWVSCETWGFMPYQCGAWNFYDSFGWGWAPGMMGGCRNRWGAGYGGVNIGVAPGGYRPILRPLPKRPWGSGAVPVIAVNRHPLTGIGPLPPRERAGPVTIAGNTVQPVHATARASYGGPGSGAVSRPAYGYAGAPVSAGARSGVRPGSSAPSYGNNSRPANSYTPRTSNTSNSSTSSRGSSGGYSSGGGSASHSSSGGGAPSGGGGGGGSHGGGSPAGGGSAHH